MQQKLNLNEYIHSLIQLPTFNLTVHYLILECYTIGGGENGVECKLPWIDWMNNTHLDCANPDNDSEGDWCPIEVNAAGEYEPKSGKWGYCNSKCPRDHEGKSKNNWYLI